MPQEALQTALALASRGYPVLPLYGVVGTGTDLKCACGNDACRTPGKHPAVLHGLQDATTSLEIVRGWGATFNYGVVTTDFVVLDVDGEIGAASLSALERKHGPLPPTWCVSTGRRQGRHRYFAPPAGVEVRCSSGKVGKGLDIKALGGYVVVPGSRHISGFSYEWWKHHHPQTHLPAEAPSWLIELANKNGNGNRANNYVALLQQRTPEGERNNTLCRIVGHFIANLIDPEIVLLAAQAISAQQFDPPLSPVEVERIVRGLCAKHYAKAKC